MWVPAPLLDDRCQLDRFMFNFATVELRTILDYPLSQTQRHTLLISFVAAGLMDAASRHSGVETERELFQSLLPFNLLEQSVS